MTTAIEQAKALKDRLHKEISSALKDHIESGGLPVRNIRIELADVTMAGSIGEFILTDVHLEFEV